jgi:nitroreductase
MEERLGQAGTVFGCGQRPAFDERSVDMFLPLAQKRRSIRKFKDRKVEMEKVDILVEAALRAPSSMGNQPWEFIVVTDSVLLQKLSKSKLHGSSFLKNAPLGIVVCANSEKSDVWVEDASIASTYIQIAAESVGLGSCWIQIRERKHNSEKTSGAYISEVLHIPDMMSVECIIGVGYPDETKPPHGRESLDYRKIHKDSYGKAFKAEET